MQNQQITINSTIETSSASSREVLLRLHSNQSEVNPLSVPTLMDSNNLEFAARLHELSYSQAYAEIVRPSRIMGLTPGANEKLETGIPDSSGLTSESFTTNNPLGIPVSDSAPSFLISDSFLGGEDSRPRIIPLPSDDLTLESSSNFITGFLSNIISIPDEAIVALCQDPLFASETRATINNLRQDLLATFNSQTSSAALIMFEEFRALQARIYEQSQMNQLGPIPQTKYYTLWKFVLFKIFSLFSDSNISQLIEYLISSNVTQGTCACLMLLYMLRPLFLTYKDVRFWRNYFYNIRTLFLRTLYDMRDIIYNPVTRIRISQFDIRTRFQQGVDLFNSRINTSFELYNQRNEVANSETLEAIRLYRLERRGVFIQDSAIHAETTSSVVNNAQRDLQENHNEITREIEANSMTGFFQRFRRGSVF